VSYGRLPITISASPVILCVKQAAIRPIEKYGSGCAGPVFEWDLDIHEELNEVGRFFRKEAALVLPRVIRPI